MPRLTGPLLAAAVTLVLAVALVAVSAEPSVAAQDDRPEETTTTTTQPPRDDSVIIKPDSGRPPEDAGDRGGALQVGLFLAIVAGIGGVATMAVRESRRRRSV